MERRRVLTGLWLLVAVSGCAQIAEWTKEPEPAPLQGGESIAYIIEYAGDGMSVSISFQADGNGFVIKPSSPAFEPERVRADLRKPFALIEAYRLAMVWLPPSERAVGAQTPLGPVVAEENYQGQPMLVVQRTKQVEARYGYDKRTGFLVYVESKLLRVRKVSSTIRNL